jgi:copper chaperone CopZ
MRSSLKRLVALLCALLLAVGLSACTKTLSISAFKGEEHAVAQTISNLQADVTAGDEQKICSNDLASAVVARLNAASGGCKQAIKSQLSELDGFEVAVQSVHLSPSGAIPTVATAHVTSIYAGKTRASTLSLVKEGGKWKITSLLA